MSEVTSLITPKPLNISVLFLVFNRLNTTKQLFQAIRKARPLRLYVAADGARRNKEGEVEKVQAVRDYIIQNIDWECELKTLFREQNLGCKYAVNEAITWFFENEKEGIILEDDTLPCPSFFYYCEHYLHKFRFDKNIAAIGGTNLLSDKTKYKNDIYSLHGSIWGWATWQDRWSEFLSFNVETCTIKMLVNYSTSLSDLINILHIYLCREKTFINTWDYQWLIFRIVNNKLSVLPSINQIINIGLEEGAHMNNDKLIFPSCSNIQNFNVSESLKRSLNYDRTLWLYKNNLNRRLIILTKKTILIIHEKIKKAIKAIPSK